LDLLDAQDYADVVDLAERFAREMLRPRIRDAEAARGPDGSVRSQYAETGLDRLELPESLGGVALGPCARALVNMRLAAADAGAALALDRFGAAAGVLAALGGEALLSERLGPLLDDPDTRALVLVDPPVRLQGGRVSGVAPWGLADRADLIIGLSGDVAWIADEGFVVTPIRSPALSASGSSQIVFDDAPLAWASTSQTAVRAALARLRLYVASLLVGVMQDSCVFSREYAMQRVAFGKPIAHHQGLAFLISDMFIASEAARLLVEDAAVKLEAGAPDAEAAAARAFVEAVEASHSIGPNGVQILGGHGFMRDFPMEKAMRDARALGLLAGGVDAAREDSFEDRLSVAARAQAGGEGDAG
jgi:alkylation response protein AidB-like acyl-CoA dehydrogenase